MLHCGSVIHGKANLIRTCTICASLVVMLGACASQLVGQQCSNAGYTPGTAEYARCYDSTLGERRQDAERAAEQDAQEAANPLPGTDSSVPLP